MKNKLTSVVFVTVCMCLCALPLLGMIVAPTNSTTENKRLAEFPSATKNGKFNINYLSEAGDYFSDHFAFRNYLVNTNSVIQGSVFNVTDINTLVKGDDGWLFYSDTLNDYLGKNTMSERGIFNVAQNLDIIQKYVEDKGAEFVFTIAPNKNSLYDKNMPYYYRKKASNKSNIKALTPLIKSSKLKYCDLFSLFKSQNETLYLKRDSHWNNKGAMLAFDKIMNQLGHEHRDYSADKVTRKNTEYGDLNKMMYPISAEPEWNYYYPSLKDYKYTTKTKSVEDPYIEIENENGFGTLLMFRDSFGNTLLPFFANEFEKACFSKGTPYAIEEYMNTQNPDYVVIEKVERNIDQLASEPPIITPVETKIKSGIQNVKSKTDLSVNKSEYNMMYLTLGGKIDNKYIKTDSKIYIRITAEGAASVYNAFGISDDNGDNGYMLYLPCEQYSGADSAKIEIITAENDKYTCVKSDTVNLRKVIEND